MSDYMYSIKVDSLTYLVKNLGWDLLRNINRLDRFKHLWALKRLIELNRYVYLYNIIIINLKITNYIRFRQAEICF